jgi:ABC-type transport system involved in cytochrome c biogenesis permease subunit
VTTFIPILVLAALVVLVASGALGLLALGLRAMVPATTGPLLSGTATDRSAVARSARAGLWVALALLVLALLARGAVTGHAPWSNLHEFSLAFAAALLATFLLLARSNPIGGLAPLASLLAAGLVVFALGLDDRVDPLVPALQQPLLLTIHVGSAVIAYAVAAVAALAAVGEIVQRASGDAIRGLPSAEVARAVGHRAVLVGFPILTLAIVLGSVWANLAWRSYWSNDPKELAAAATWLVFGAYLHVASRRDRWATLAPWLILLGGLGVVFTYIGAGLFIIGEHSYGRP